MRKTKAIRVNEDTYNYLSNVSTLTPADKLSLIIDLITNNPNIRQAIVNELSKRMALVGKVYKEDILSDKEMLLRKMNKGRAKADQYTIEDLKDIE